MFIVLLVTNFSMHTFAVCVFVTLSRPIKPGIGGRKQTFEDLLEEQLRLEEQRLKSAQKEQVKNVKWICKKKKKQLKAASQESFTS